MAEPTSTEAPDLGPIEWLKKKLGVAGKEPASAGGKTAQQAADDAQGEGNPSDQASNTGAAGQSTDSVNKY